MYMLETDEDVWYYNTLREAQFTQYIYGGTITKLEKEVKEDV